MWGSMRATRAIHGRAWMELGRPEEGRPREQGGLTAARWRSGGGSARIEEEKGRGA